MSLSRVLNRNNNVFITNNIKSRYFSSLTNNTPNTNNISPNTATNNNPNNAQQFLSSAIIYDSMRNRRQKRRNIFLGFILTGFVSSIFIYSIIAVKQTPLTSIQTQLNQMNNTQKESNK